jgi:hypothetical protein
MRAFPRIVCPILLLLSATACADNPAAPTPLAGPEPDGPILAISCNEEVGGYRCRASLMSPTTASQDVTGLATWSTSDTSIATVNTVGYVNVTQGGEVAIRAEYRGLAGFTAFSVQPGGLRYYHRALGGWIRDRETEAKIGGVAVEIVSGPNAGRSTTAGPDGSYRIYDLEPGTFTVRFTTAGYARAEYSFTLPGDRFNSLDAWLTK